MFKNYNYTLNVIFAFFVVFFCSTNFLAKASDKLGIINLSETTKKEINFEKNSNQYGASQSYFFVKDNNIQVSFDKSGITFKLYNSSFSEAGGNSLQPQTLKLKFLNSSNTEILALDKADFYTNYYNDFVPQGATHIPNYKKLV